MLLYQPPTLLVPALLMLSTCLIQVRHEVKNFVECLQTTDDSNNVVVYECIVLY